MRIYFARVLFLVTIRRNQRVPVARLLWLRNASIIELWLRAFISPVTDKLYGCRCSLLFSRLFVTPGTKVVSCNVISRHEKWSALTKKYRNAIRNWELSYLLSFLSILGASLLLRATILFNYQWDSEDLSVTDQYDWSMIVTQRSCRYVWCSRGGGDTSSILAEVNIELQTPGILWNSEDLSVTDQYDWSMIVTQRSCRYLWCSRGGGDTSSILAEVNIELQTPGIF